MRLTIFTFALLALASTSRAVPIFQQNFNSSAVVSDYVSATPNSGQFNAISTSNGSASFAITSGALAYTRSGDPNTTTFSRTTDFTPTPDAIIYQFDLAISGNSAAQTTAAVFQIGSAFGTANAAESNANVYARIGVNLGANAGEFSLRNISTSTNSPTLSGTQSITWVLNNTAGALSYTPPAGGSSNIAAETADIYAGNTLLFDDVAVLTTTQIMTDLKFAFTAGLATIAIDNIVINAIPEPTGLLPLAIVGLLLSKRRPAR